MRRARAEEYPPGMDRQEADALCAKLAAEHSDRKTHRWIVRGDDEAGWSVVKIGLPPLVKNKLTAEGRGGEVPEGPGPASGGGIPGFHS